MNKLARPELLSMKPYAKPYDMVLSEGYEDKIYLHANENGYFLFGYENLNRYPESMQPPKLLEKLSSIYGVTIDRIIVTRGADEAIDLLVRAFCRAYVDKIIVCPPTYSMYEISANIQGAEVLRVPLVARDNFSLDVDGILTSWTPEVKLVFLCYPNNPTGTLLKLDSILELCQKLADRSLIVVDEAYIEFGDIPSLVNFIDKYPNLVVLRTLSKFYGLAGIRCGSAIANVEIINLLQKVIAPYPLPTPTIDIVTSYLTKDNLDKLNINLKFILNDRAMLAEFFATLGCVKKVWDSYTNFLLIKVDDVKAIVSLCHKNNIVIRNFSNDPYLENCIRVSIGSTRENYILMEVLYAFKNTNLL